MAQLHDRYENLVPDMDYFLDKTVVDYKSYLCLDYYTAQTRVVVVVQEDLADTEDILRYCSDYMNYHSLVVVENLGRSENQAVLGKQMVADN